MTASQWQTLATADQVIDIETDYDVQVLIDGQTATLSVGGVEMVSHGFNQSLTDGEVGVATGGAQDAQ